MKRIWLILFCLLFLSACQPTPETEVIPNKGDDTLQTVIKENGAGFSAAEYGSSLPEWWEGLLDTGNGAVTVTASGPSPFQRWNGCPYGRSFPAAWT